MNFSPLPEGFSVPGSGSPRFRQDALKIRNQLADLSSGDLSELMKMSPVLGEKTLREFQEFPAHPGKAALFSYSGTSFKHLEPLTLSSEALDFAASRLLILSGLYGILSPFDSIAPYRLEMKTPLVPKGSEGVKTLAAFWKPKLTGVLEERLSSLEGGSLLNLASSEYSSAVDLKKTGIHSVSIHFRDRSKSGTYRTVAMYAKEARGRMLRHILENRIDDPVVLQEHSGCGYLYSPGLSDPENMVFLRD